MGRFNLTTRAELAPGAIVFVRVQSWADAVDDSKNLDEDTGAKWVDAKLPRLAASIFDDEACTKLTFEDAADLRSQLSGGQVTYLLRVLQGDGKIPCTFREYNRGGENAAPDAGPDGGEVQLPAE